MFDIEPSTVVSDGLLAFLLYFSPVCLTVPLVLGFSFSKFFLPFTVVLHVLASFQFQFFLQSAHVFVPIHLGQQLKLCEIFSHLFQLELIVS